MNIEPERCFACGDCVPICPVGAILLHAGDVSIDQDKCVECGVCWRGDVCLTSVFMPGQLSWPRVLRAMFSDPATVHPRTRLAGRGMEEIKTNDVRGLYTGDTVAVSAEVGRPGGGASFRDVQCITRALAGVGACFAVDNPLIELIADPVHGDLADDVLDERVLSAIVECLVLECQLAPTLAALIEASSRLPVPVLVSVAGARLGDGSMAYQPAVRALGLETLSTGKMNLGFLA